MPDGWMPERIRMEKRRGAEKTTPARRLSILLSLTRKNHHEAPHFAKHLAASTLGLPHQITEDMLWSPKRAGRQSLTQTVALPGDFSGLNVAV
jgi:hypothetical protein